MHRREKMSLTEGPKIFRFIDYVVKSKNFTVSLSLQIYFLKSLGAKAPWPPWGTRL